MFNFNLQRSFVKTALLGEKHFYFLRFFKKIIFFSIGFLLLLLLWGFLFYPFSEKGFRRILALLLFALVFLILAILQDFFYQGYLKKPKRKISLTKVLLKPEKYNLANFLSFEAGKRIYRAFKWAKRKKLLPLNSTFLFYFLLESDASNFIFLRGGLNKERLQRNLREYLKKDISKFDLENPLFTLDFKETLLLALKRAVEKGKEVIEIGDLISALSEIEPHFKKFLLESELKAEDIKNLVRFYEAVKAKKEKKRRFWHKENLELLFPIGREFAAGYTITLDQYSINWTNLALKEIQQTFIGHQQEIEEIERILSRGSLNNVLLVGRPGSGRAQIVRHFAKRSYLGHSLPLLNYKKVIALNLPSLIAQIETIEEAEKVLDRIFQEVRNAGNVILVVENFHNYVEAKPRPGVLNIAGLLSSYLEKTEFQVIAITTYAGLHRHIERNPSILNYFNKVEVRELTEEETLQVLEDWVFYFENRYKKIITYPALKEIVNLAGRYLPDTAFPQKALDLLDEVMVAGGEEPEKALVLPEDVDKIVTEKTEIPVGEIKEKEKEILLNLEALIHKRIINQEEAVKEISQALRRARTEVTIRKGPMGSFLFLGPTGVGKTETSKALAEIYFGGENRMIRLDMSEFQQVGDLTRLIGSSSQEGILTTQVRENPFSLVLLDEIEKAHPNILNLFLQVLDEGFLTDGLGRKVNFRNTIVIGTSNAGSELIWKMRGNIKKDELIFFLIERKIFRPEFLNRFDGVIIFQPLSRGNLLDIAELMFAKLKQNLEEKEIILLIPPSVKEKIVDLSYDPAFGAREMRRVIQDKIENILAVALLEGKIKRGDKVRIDLEGEEDFKLTLLNQKEYSLLR